MYRLHQVSDQRIQLLRLDLRTITRLRKECIYEGLAPEKNPGRKFDIPSMLNPDSPALQEINFVPLLTPTLVNSDSSYRQKSDSDKGDGSLLSYINGERRSETMYFVGNGLDTMVPTDESDKLTALATNTMKTSQPEHKALQTNLPSLHQFAVIGGFEGILRADPHIAQPPESNLFKAPIDQAGVSYGFGLLRQPSRI